MANNKAIAISALKAERAKIVASIQSQLDGIDAAIRALGGAPATGKAKAVPKKGGGRKGVRPEKAIQAAMDARAVKAGTATPEQLERYNARQAAKGKGEAPVPKGASLAEVVPR